MDMAKLTINCDLKNLEKVRGFIKENLYEMRLDNEPFANQVVLAIDEACANSIIHANHCNENRDISVEIYKKSNDLHINLFDFAPPFDLNSYEMCDIREKIKRADRGGMGICLIKKVMDEIYVEPHDGFCVYRFIKHLSAC